MCKVATVRYIARKTNGKGGVDGEFELNVKRGEGKLSTHVTAKIKIEGELTAEQKGNYLNKPMLVIHRMIEGEWNIENAELTEEAEKVLV
jgi:putative redox protein